MKNLFIGLLMFAGASSAFASNGVEMKNSVENREIENVKEAKVVNINEDDFCSITITRTVKVLTFEGSTTFTYSATGTGSTCAEAEAAARAAL